MELRRIHWTGFMSDISQFTIITHLSHDNFLKTVRYRGTNSVNISLPQG